MKFFSIAIIALFLIGCEPFDDMFNYSKNKHDKIFNIEFQSDSDPKTEIISSKCKNNSSIKYIYYETPELAHNNYFEDTKNLISKDILKPYWDIRYVNSINKYKIPNNLDNIPNYSLVTGINFKGDDLFLAISEFAKDDIKGSLISYKCINGNIAAGTTINLIDSIEQEIEYGGPQSTFMYRFPSNKILPWKKNRSGNLMIEANFIKPIYEKYDNNMGASVNFGVILYNKMNKQYLNYTIGLYSAGNAWVDEQVNLKFDTTTNIVHIATVAKDSSWWITKSPKSSTLKVLKSTIDEFRDENEIDKWNEKFRVNIGYSNLLDVLNELKRNPPQNISQIDFGLNPEDWQVQNIYIQYEIEEEGGKAMMSGSFKDFNAYISKLPL